MHRKKILQEVEVMISADRNRTHGDPLRQLAFTTKLKEFCRTEEFLALTPVEQEALGSILNKVSRIVCGSPTMDHWQDIAGYAAIAAESRSKQRTAESDQ